MMKKLLLFLTLLAFICTSVDASTMKKRRSKKRHSRSKSDTELKFGGRFGYTLSTMLVSPGETSSGAVGGFHIGGVVEYPLSEMFGIEGGLFFNKKGTVSEFYSETTIPPNYYLEMSGITKIKPAYLEIPLDIKLSIDRGFGKWLLFAGPYLAIGIGGKYTSEVAYSSDMPGFDPELFGLGNESGSIRYGTKEDSHMKRGDLGFIFGAGWDFDGVQIRGQYSLGLSNLSPASGQSMKNLCYMFSIGYMIGGD